MNQKAEKYHRNLSDNMREYLSKERGMTDETIEHFVLGETEDGALAIPIMDKDGKVKAIQCRYFSGKAKYKSLGSTKDLLFNEAVISDDQQEVVLVEGPLDACLAWQLGVTAVSGVAGCAAFDGWIDRLKDVPKLYVVYDNDKAGKAAVKKIADKLSNVIVVELPHIEGGKDITDHVVKHGLDLDGLKKLMQKAENKRTETEDDLPFLDSLTKIRPALDFIGELALCTVAYPVPTKKGIVSAPYIVTSNKEVFPCNAQELAARGFYAQKEIKNAMQRWELSDFKEWLKGDFKSTPDKAYYCIREQFERFVDVVDERHITLLSLWVLSTYFYPLFHTVGYLYIGGVAGSGKTTTGEVIASLSFNGMLSGNLTVSAMFRLLDSLGCTLVADENEQLSGGEKQDLSCLLSGIHKNSVVFRSERDSIGNFHPQGYCIFSPKVLINIGGLISKALIRRSIPVGLLPTNSNEKRSHSPYSYGDEYWSSIRRHMYAVMMDYFKEVRDIAETCDFTPVGLENYTAIWLPVLVMAEFVQRYIDRDITTEIKTLAIETVDESKAEKKFSYQDHLLQAIGEMIRYQVEITLRCSIKGYFVKTSDIHDFFKKYIGVEYNDIQEQKIITASYVGKLIKRFSIGQRSSERIERGATRGFWINLPRLDKALKRNGYEGISQEDIQEDRSLTIEKYFGEDYLERL